MISKCQTNQSAVASRTIDMLHSKCDSFLIDSSEVEIRSVNAQTSGGYGNGDSTFQLLFCMCFYVPYLRQVWASACARANHHHRNCSNVIQFYFCWKVSYTWEDIYGKCFCLKLERKTQLSGVHPSVTPDTSSRLWATSTGLPSLFLLHFFQHSS